MSMSQKIRIPKFVLLVAPAILFLAFVLSFGAGGTAYAATISSRPEHSNAVSPHTVSGGGCFNSGWDSACISVNAARQVAPDGYVTGAPGDCLTSIVLLKDGNVYKTAPINVCFAIGAHIVGPKVPATAGHYWQTAIVATDGVNTYVTYSPFQYT
jgi:hypothetical protein